MKKLTKSIRSINDDIIAMTVICNIQAMQKVCFGQSFSYDDFNGNTVNELYELQDLLIPQYNEAISKN